MIVYADILIILNLAVDYFLLRAAAFLQHLYAAFLIGRRHFLALHIPAAAGRGFGYFVPHSRLRRYDVYLFRFWQNQTLFAQLWCVFACNLRLRRGYDSALVSFKAERYDGYKFGCIFQYFACRSYFFVCCGVFSAAAAVAHLFGHLKAG